MLMLYSVEQVIEKLQCTGKTIGEQHSEGNSKATQVVNLYSMLYACQDPATGALLCAAYEDWERSQNSYQSVSTLGGRHV